MPVLISFFFSVIFCGHFPDDVRIFTRDEIEAVAAGGESRGAWYRRQIEGSANFTGGRIMDVMTGNLDHQIEHHLFPDLPSNRYQEIAPKVQEIVERYGIPYVSGSMPRQVASAWGKVARLALPNGWLRRASQGLAEVTALPTRLLDATTGTTRSAA